MSAILSSCGYLDYSKAYELASKARKSQGYNIGCNTWVRHNGDDVEVIYHSTPVITFHPDNSMTLRTNGWTTPTTKLRFTELLISAHRNLSSFNGVWLWDSVPFYDGMKVDSLGRLLDPYPPSYVAAKEFAHKQIGEASEAVDALLADPVFYAKVRLGVLHPKHTRETATILAGKLTANAIQELALRNVPLWEMLPSVINKRIERMIRKGEL